MADKQELAHLLAEMAAMLELKGENVFKIRAYQTAARTLERMDGEWESLERGGNPSEVKGIGKTLGQHIREYLATGTVSYYQELKESLPPVLFELTRIPGLGPKKAMLLHTQLGIQSIGELEYACRENRLVELPGFGSKTQEKILQGIEYVKQFQGQFLLGDVWPLAEQIVRYLRSRPEIDRAEVAGSVRRRKETVKDLDIVVTGEEPEKVMDLVTAMPGVQQVSGRGPTKMSLSLANGLNMDVRVVEPAAYAPALHHFTGSKEHHMELRSLARQKGYKINEYSVEGCQGNLLISREEDLYAGLGLAYIPPELREGLGEIRAAAQGKLPVLVTEEDIKGTFHVHTTYSDGGASLVAMAEQARMMGFSYLGITDHSQTAVYARGLKLSALQEQWREINRLNEQQPGFVLLKGIESDILPDGSLDYPDGVLAEFDFVIASVHSHFRQSEAEMTRRLVKAMQNPYVSMLGHPTGRILLGRDGYAVDMSQIVQAAANTGTCIEINASPYRLDLDWRWCIKAKEKGVRLAINPDAHSREELANIRYGIAVARKGWLTAQDVINTLPVEQVCRVLQSKRN
ncbi:dna polymerase beta thumb [Lucifera butyrica]|uniref:DNA-directed DNA polymerase n=1 Tax=Lucifera butyrica TaxID=1351585 RepID=A0A498QYQ2_9FIRM|nr:dna polymerase beta thumb [Lucifera butyrica]